MESIVVLLLDTFRSMGYVGIFVLMTIESSFIPFPSEVVIPPAAYLAFKGEMNIYLIVVVGILGSIFGALINYFLAKFLGRKIVYKLVENKWAKFLLLDKEKMVKAEEYFKKYDGVSTFFGRLVPAVRQLISIPAGFSKMALPKFILFTSFGAGLWIIVLALLGFYFGANEELLSQYYSEITLFILFSFCLFLSFFIVKSIIRRKKI